MEDHELLREYAEHRSDQAFAQLVARHIDLVYSTAFRLVGETHLAKDVVQMVFIGLARKPRSIRNPQALAGWLYHTTRFKAAGVLRTEQRRRQRESAAMELNTLAPDSQSLWPALAPHLDEAMGTLEHTDQDALVLRFFQGKSLREVGQALGTSEDAAQKRVARALDKLRSYFARKGMATSSSLIASVIAAHAVQTAPAGLASSVAAAALAGATGGGTAALALKVVGVMTITNLKIAAVAVLVIGAVSTPILLNHRSRAPNRGQAAGAPQPEPSKPGPAAPFAAGLNSQTANAEGGAVKKSLIEQLMEAPKLSAGEIEAYLQQNKRGAESLLAAFRVSGDQAYLREAAANFPNDPAVQFAVICYDACPDQRRQWLDGFKAASPDNALAWYFSALDYFKTKQTDLAIQEFAEATRKPSFKNYAAQTSQAVEEMCNLAGRSSLEAKAASACPASAPHLLQLKRLANEVMQAQQQYRQQGDAASADSLTYMGLVLGRQLSTGGNSQTVIDQLMGIALQNKFLGQLDPAANYDFLGRPVSEVAGELDRLKDAIKQAAQLKDRVLPSLNETELANYLDRVKVYGEPEAWAWLQTKHGQP
jgi:RNA polymerase sigma factor (sigma-70 family)